MSSRRQSGTPVIKAEGPSTANATDRKSHEMARYRHYQQPLAGESDSSLSESNDVDMVDGRLQSQYDEGYQTSQLGHSAASSRASHRPSRTPAGNIISITSRTHSPAVNQETIADEDIDRALSLDYQEHKYLVSSINALRQKGVEDLVVPLPKIVVVGDQSTGKSSLIEALSQIKVPRNVGCCTRCPLEINITEDTSDAARWTCKVSLRKTYMHDTFANNENDPFLVCRGSIAGTPQPSVNLGPWIPQDPAEDTLFATLYNKDDVEDVLHWAQLATLNPGTRPTKYMPGFNQHTPRTLQVKFSPNVVRLDISGPGLPNLSFFDLPGVINVTENAEEAYLVPLVRNLVKEYITPPNCINLLALPMTDDAANSSAAGIIKEVGAQDRTIGVLTKPDRVQLGESWEQWESMLSGERYQLGHGYYVTKQPNQDMLGRGISHSEARAQELEFFTSNEPWASDLSQYSQRFGTHRLSNDLSQLLIAQIVKSLPYINEQVNRKATTIEIELAELPEPPAENLPLVLTGKIYTLKNEIEKRIDGGYPYNLFKKNWHSTAEEFAKIIMNSTPKVLLDITDTPKSSMNKLQEQSKPPRGPVTPTKSNVRVDLTLSDAEDEPQLVSKTILPDRTDRKRQATPHAVPITPKKPKFNARPPPSKKFTVTQKASSLEDVREVIKAAQTAGIPNQVDPKAIEVLSQQSVAFWITPAQELVNIAGNMLKQLVLERFEDVLSEWKQTQLFVEASRIIHDYLDSMIGQELSAIQRTCHLEVSKPITFNAVWFDQLKRENLARLRTMRRAARVANFILEQEKQNRVVKERDVADEQLGIETFRKEIETMATVQAYYMIAASRFVDTVCQAIDGELFVSCKTSICQQLIDGLGIEKLDAQERCARLMAEDPNREIRRAQLKHEKATLREAQDSLTDMVSRFVSRGKSRNPADSQA